MFSNRIRSLTALIVLSAAYALPQPAPKKVTHPAPKNTYLTTPFDGTVTPHFMGHNLDALLDAMDPTKFEKDEFETTEQFQTRKAAMKSPGSLPSGSLLAFVFSPDGPIDIRYDADARRFIVQPKFEPQRKDILGKSGDPYGAALIWSSEIHSREYTGENAMGASVSVTSFQGSKSAVAVPIPANWGREREREDVPAPALSIPSSPDQARALKSNLRILITGTIAPEGYAKGTSYGVATFSSPTEHLIDYRYLRITPRELWVFNDETGEVLRRKNWLIFTALK